MRGRLIPTYIKRLPYISFLSIQCTMTSCAWDPSKVMPARPSSTSPHVCTTHLVLLPGAVLETLWGLLGAHKQQLGTAAKSTPLTSRSKGLKDSLLSSHPQIDCPKVHSFIFESRSCRTEDSVTLELSGGQRSSTLMH